MKIILEVPIEVTVARQTNTDKGIIVDVDDSQVDCAIRFLRELRGLQGSVKE